MKKLTPLNRKLLKQCEKGNTQQVLALLAEGADVNATDNEGWVPLTTALGMNHQETAEALIKAGANVNELPRNSNFDDTPLMIAAHKGFLSITEMLLASRCGCERHNEQWHYCADIRSRDWTRRRSTTADCSRSRYTRPQ